MLIPLILDDEVRTQIKALCQLAEANPVQADRLQEYLSVPENKEKHMAQMTRQTMIIPVGFMATFSIEKNHPIGDCRHITVSIQDDDALPPPPATWMIAKEFGFWGELTDCDGIWEERLRGHGLAIGLVQTLEPQIKPIDEKTETAGSV